MAQVKMGFKDKQLDAEYKDKGYLRVPFLDETQLARIDEIIGRYIHLDDKTNFVISNQSLDLATCRKLNDEINAVITPSLDRLVEHYKILFSVVASKNHTPNSKIKFHTDRCYIDEAKNTPINLWVPLCDVTKDNGALGVFEGSQKFTFTYRGINNAEYYMEPEIYDFIENNCIRFVDAKRGDVVFYQPGLIHGSMPNRSDHIRHALLITLQPENDGLIYCFQRHRFNFFDYIDVYDAHLEFWVMPVQPEPAGILKRIYKVRNTKPRVTIGSLKQMIAERQPESV